MPLTFRLYKNGTLINSGYTHLANCFLAGSAFTNRKNTFHRLNLLPDNGSSEIIMASSEHVVTTASNHVQTFNNRFTDPGFDLRPGFDPPAGDDSVFSRHLPSNGKDSIDAANIRFGRRCEILSFRCLPQSEI